MSNHTANDLYDMFANQASAADILRMTTEELTRSIRQLRQGNPDTISMDDEEIALSIAYTAYGLENAAWASAGCPTPAGWEDEGDGRTRPDFWLMDWRSW